jgi:hypothetical protein
MEQWFTIWVVIVDNWVVYSLGWLSPMFLLEALARFKHLV